MDDTEVFAEPPRGPGALRELITEERAVEAVFEAARTRAESVAEGIARVRIAEGGFAPSRSWDVLQPLPPDHGASVRQDAGGTVLDLGGMRVALSGEGRLRVEGRRAGVWLEQVGPPVWGRARPETLGIRLRQGDALPPGRDGVLARLQLALDPADRLWGFGQRTGGLDRRGRRLTNWTSDSFGVHHHRGSDNLYQAQPVFLAVQAGRAFGAFLHVSHLSRLDAGYTNPDRLGIDALGGEIDLFLFAGPTPAAVVEQLTRLTGRPLLPPHWALGFHQSRWGYDRAEQVLAVVDGFRDRDLPLDAVHLDIDYMRGFRSFTWDPVRFPDPRGFCTAVHERGARVVAIIDPGIKDDPGSGYRAADEALTGAHVLRNADGSPFRGYVWPDRALFPDFARAEVRAWWGEMHRESLVEAGVDGVWNDMNEPTAFDAPFSSGQARDRPFPLALRHGAEDERASHLEVRNLYGTLEGRATFEALARLRPERRPWVLTRSAGVGSQRTCATWMGDNDSWWEHLAMSVPQLLSMGLSGSPHAGVDIGGFFENAGAELFARWMELGAFYPFMRDHTAQGTRAQEPWAFGAEVETLARQALELRYRLLPYLVTLAHEAAATGAPLMRALGYAFPDVEATLDEEDAFLLGPWLLVAPATRPRQRWRAVTLPPGAWRDFWSGREVVPERRDEARPALLPTPPGRPPLLLRQGALLPLGDVRRSTATPVSELRLVVTPATASRYRLVEDDGLSPDADGAGTAVTEMALDRDEGALRLELQARAGGFLPAPRTFTVELRLDRPPDRVVLDGADVSAAWDGERHAASVSWPDDGAGHELLVSD
ncbi:MAG TPA: TIM-barrel domain-containing protein [Trueperaceae bacterium]|nr:TIM-barrel domain-containing protein [Trueperaceae bacterium]